MSIKTRISKLVAYSARRNHKGPLLTYDEDLIIHKDDYDQILAAVAAGRRYVLVDEPLPPGGVVYGGPIDSQWPPAPAGE